ncbi:MAG: hypothetical protein NTW74_12550 [Acidobacteria bacterium]|jgi:hypothetical protein|nr:hypothetical protein [Acidobacteriota bacterium]
MRTTIDLPDALFRKTKANAALRGTSMKELIVAALEKDLNATPPKETRHLTLPLIRMPKGKKLNLKGVDFDDLLA